MRWKRKKGCSPGTGDYLNVCIMVAGTRSEACDESRGTKKFTGGNKICSRSPFDRENLSFFFFFLFFFIFFLRAAERRGAQVPSSSSSSSFASWAG